MSGFSNDDQWWWDGAKWIATSQVVLPELPMTEFERSGKLNTARTRMQQREALLGANMVEGGLYPILSLPLAVPLLVVQHYAIRDFRLWTLEQLALASSLLRGPDEAMLAGETTMRASFPGTVSRDYAVAVTSAHVLVLRIDSLYGQPRWVAMAAHPSEVNILLRSGLFGNNPTLWVTNGRWQWPIRGDYRVFKPQPVLKAWREAAARSVANTA